MEHTNIHSKNDIKYIEQSSRVGIIYEQRKYERCQQGKVEGGNTRREI